NTIVSQSARQRNKPDLLQDDVAVRVRENLLLDAVTAAEFGVGQVKSGDARFDSGDLKLAVTFLLRKETHPIGDQQAEIARAGHINAGKINLIKNSVAEREPDPAGVIESSPYAGFGARRPARWNARPSWRKGVVTHESVPECSL